MASSFRRKKSTSSSSSSASASQSSLLLGLQGTKPWTGGVTLTSTGLTSLDAILGAGQPLTACLYLELDRWTSLGLSIVHYWCAQALAHGQTLWIPTTLDDDDDFPCSCCTQSFLDAQLWNALPRDLHMDKARKNNNSSSSSTAMGLETLNEDDDDDDTNEDDDETKLLQNAWQYSQKIQQERSGVSSSRILGKNPKTNANSTHIFCHSFNLSGRLRDQMTNEQLQALTCTDAIPCSVPSGCSNDDNDDAGWRCRGLDYFRKLKTKLDTLLIQKKNIVVRLLLLHPDPRILSVALGLLLSHVRTKNLPVVLLVAVQRWRWEGAAGMTNGRSLSRLRQLSDVVLETEGFVGRGINNYPPPAEFSTFQGLLHVRRASTVTAATATGHFCDLTVSKRPAAFCYGLRRDSRKLHISLLHIPPEDYAAGGSSVGGGGVRSGAGKPKQQAVGGCSSAGHLDF